VVGWSRRGGLILPVDTTSQAGCSVGQKAATEAPDHSMSHSRPLDKFTFHATLLVHLSGSKAPVLAFHGFAGLTKGHPEKQT